MVQPDQTSRCCSWVFPLITADLSLCMDTPHDRWYKLLDSTYRMHTCAKAEEFHKQGWVLALLFMKAPDDTGDTGDSKYCSDTFTIIDRLDNGICTVFDHFVVISARENSNVDCPIINNQCWAILLRECSLFECNTNLWPTTVARNIQGGHEKELYK